MQGTHVIGLALVALACVLLVTQRGFTPGSEQALPQTQSSDPRSSNDAVVDKLNGETLKLMADNVAALQAKIETLTAKIASLTSQGSNAAPVACVPAEAENRVQKTDSSGSSGETISHYDALFAVDGALPRDTIVDTNIGTNLSPIEPKGDGSSLVLVEPLFEHCNSLFQKYQANHKVYMVCVAVSNFTGMAPFYKYWDQGVSSSLSKVQNGTSHGRLKIVNRRSVVVLEAVALFNTLVRLGNTLRYVKLDMQGHEFAALRNMKSLLQQGHVQELMLECFCPKDGKQIYQINNACEDIGTFLEPLGFNVQHDHYRGECKTREWSDIRAKRK